MKTVIIISMVCLFVSRVQANLVIGDQTEPQGSKALACAKLDGKHDGNRLASSMGRLSNLFRDAVSSNDNGGAGRGAVKGILQCTPNLCRFRWHQSPLSNSEVRNAAAAPDAVNFSEDGIDFSIHYNRMETMAGWQVGLDRLSPALYGEAEPVGSPGVIIALRKLAIIINQPPEESRELWVCYSLNDHELELDNATFLSSSAFEDLIADLEEVEESIEWDDSVQSVMDAGAGGPGAGVEARQPLFGLAPISLSRAVDILGQPDLQMHVVTLSAGAFLGSLAITAYQFLGLGGRQKVVAAVIPPGSINGFFGRTGYRVPGHETYTLEDVSRLQQALAQLSTEAEMQAHLDRQDQELVAYFYVVLDYVRQAQAIEFSELCPDSDRCA